MCTSELQHRNCFPSIHRENERILIMRRQPYSFRLPLIGNRNILWKLRNQLNLGRICQFNKHGEGILGFVKGLCILVSWLCMLQCNLKINLVNQTLQRYCFRFVSVPVCQPKIQNLATARCGPHEHSPVPPSDRFGSCGLRLRTWD
jgi:hypothetical protein